jgi:O-antigen/teichoic acid export membrane protein
LLLAGNLIAYQGSVLMVSAALGGLAVAVLSVSKAIIEVVRQSLYSINLALCPDFARMEALGHFAQLRTVHRLTMAVVAAITLAITAVVWFEGTQIINVWTRGRIQTDVTLLRLFLVLMAFQTPWAASSTVATATNRHKAQAVGYFFAAVIGVAVIAASVHRLGTWAVPIGLIVGEALCCYHFVIRATCRIIGEPYRAFAMRFWAGFVAVASVAFVTARAIHLWLPGALLLRSSVAGVCTLTAAALCGIVVWLTPEDRKLFVARLRPALPAYLVAGIYAAMGRQVPNE